LLRKTRDFITAKDTGAIARRAGAIAFMIRVASAGLPTSRRSSLRG
jgi:hypothetical protein